MNKTYHCKRCRSQNVNFSPKAIWCWETQDMVLEYAIDDRIADCWECEDEVDAVVRTEDGLPLSERDLFEGEVFSQHLRLKMTARDTAQNEAEPAQA
jgi:hypothetical protein